MVWRGGVTRDQGLLEEQRSGQYSAHQFTLYQYNYEEYCRLCIVSIKTFTEEECIIYEEIQYLLMTNMLVVVCGTIMIDPVCWTPARPPLVTSVTSAPPVSDQPTHSADSSQSQQPLTSQSLNHSQ